MTLSLRRRRWSWAVGMMAAAAATAGFCDPASVTPPAFPPMDLQAPFRTRSPWRLLVTQGPQTEDYGGNPAPGALDLCLQKNPAEPCIRKPVSAEPPTDAGFTPGWGPHYLEIAKPVYPNGQGRTPLLQLVTASLHAGDGDQLVVTQLLKYDRSRDVFERIYFHSTGTNTNDEVRFIADGPLKGAVISAEPTQNAPYAYWITVNTLTSARTYRQAIRYRSATRYNDGNPLAVIDSEMPNIEQRLGLWRPGTPLPTPRTTPCPKPRLKHMELWCQ